MTRQNASHAPTLLRGAALGVVAAAVGAGIYYAIAEVTGYEFGLMSHRARAHGRVRRASRRSGRGGWRYQTLAMFLCYAAISATYVPRVILGHPEAGGASKAGARSRRREARERRGHRCHQARAATPSGSGAAELRPRRAGFSRQSRCCSCFRWRCPCLGASTT